MINDQKLNELITAHSSNLRKSAYWLTKDNVEAEDLYQDTLLKVVSNIHHFKEGTNFKSWSNTIMRNTFISNYRKRKRTMVCADVNDYVEFNAPGFTDENEGDYLLFKSELNKNIESLPSKHQEIIGLLKSGHPYKKMATMLSLPLGTIKSRVFFARQALENQLQKSQILVPCKN